MVERGQHLQVARLTLNSDSSKTYTGSLLAAKEKGLSSTRLSPSLDYGFSAPGGRRDI